MVNLDKLEFHVATRDASGNPVLVEKPKPAAYATADAVSRRHWTHAVAREREEVEMAAKEAMLPPRPANWERGSPIDRLAWIYEAKRG